MCFGKAPEVKPMPAPPTVTQAAPEEAEMNARRNVRKRLAAAVNTRTTLLGSPENGNKTLLGQ